MSALDPFRSDEGIVNKELPPVESALKVRDKGRVCTKTEMPIEDTGFFLFYQTLINATRAITPP
jgi:hypothetical protein